MHSTIYRLLPGLKWWAEWKFDQPSSSSHTHHHKEHIYRFCSQNLFRYKKTEHNPCYEELYKMCQTASRSERRKAWDKPQRQKDAYTYTHTYIHFMPSCVYKSYKKVLSVKEEVVLWGRRRRWRAEAEAKVAECGVLGWKLVKRNETTDIAHTSQLLALPAEPHPPPPPPPPFYFLLSTFFLPSRSHQKEGQGVTLYPSS